MSKEATTCACGGVFAFMQYHWPHCDMNPLNIAKMPGSEKSGSLHSRLRAKFSKAELAQIASHGPVRDEKLRSRRRGAK